MNIIPHENNTTRKYHTNIILNENNNKKISHEYNTT